MSPVHMAHKLTVEVATDPRTDNRAFCMEYAIAYSMRVLTGGRTRKAKGAAPKLVKDRRTGGGDGKPVDLRPLDRFRLLPLSETDPRSWQEEKGSRTWKERLDSEAYDIAQDAAVLFFAARRKAIETGDDSCRIDTRGAVRFAVRDRRKEQSRKSAKERKRCSVCRFDPLPCDACINRIETAKAQWARYNRPTGLAKEVRDTLTSVAADTAFETAVSDLLPFREAKHSLRKETSRIFRYIASGSTATEIASMLGVSQQYVSAFLTAVRRSYTVESFRSTPFGTPEVKGSRVYGQGQGTTSMWVGPMADLLDAEFGHDASDYVPCHVLPAPTGKPNPPADDTAYPTRPTTDPFTVGPEFAFAYGDVFGEDALLHTW